MPNWRLYLNPFPFKGWWGTDAEDVSLRVVLNYSCVERHRIAAGCHSTIRLGRVRCQETWRSIVRGVQSSLFQVRRRIKCPVLPCPLRISELTVGGLSSIRTKRLLLIRHQLWRLSTGTCRLPADVRTEVVRQATNVDSVWGIIIILRVVRCCENNTYLHVNIAEISYFG